MIKNFFQFVISPTLFQPEKTKITPKLLLHFLGLYLFYMAINACIISLSSFLNLPKIESVEAVRNENSVVMSVLIIAFIAPVIEEIAFRLSLRFSVVNVTLSLGVLSFFITNKIPHKAFDSMWLRSGIVLVTLLIFFFIIRFFSEKLALFWKTHFRYILYFFCITFAFIHIFNFPLSFRTFLLMPLLTFPQLLGAFVFSFVRIKYGFFIGVFFHIFNNLLPAIGLFL